MVLDRADGGQTAGENIVHEVGSNLMSWIMYLIRA